MTRFERITAPSAIERDPEEYYTPEEWTRAEQYAADTGDRSELRFMRTEAEQFAAYRWWAGLRNSDMDFEEWRGRRVPR